MMLWPILISGFTLGAAGSLHCIGMCGPLSLALPTRDQSPISKFFSLLSYQLGRLLTYSMLGLLIGLARRSIHITGYQQAFSIILGAMILCVAVMYVARKRMVHLKAFDRFYSFTRGLVNRTLRAANGPTGFLLMGMANGLLPCGMIYIALLTTLSLSGPVESVSFMAMFGLGTLPAMMIIGYLGMKLNWSWRSRLRSMLPVIIALTGVVLVLRGLNLGIPYISPAFGQHKEVINCHP
jgi:sulfite exporter TauE/SafE